MSEAQRGELVAGIDSSTQSCKVVVCDAATGTVRRSGTAPHPDGTEIDPRHWWVALQAALAAAGGLDDVAAVAVGGQQHGMVCLDRDGAVVRDALLWNDTRSAAAAVELIDELPGGALTWAERVGTVPVASLTVTKLRWLAQHEPHHAQRTAAVCLPHDWLSWQLAGGRDLDALVTDRGDASGTGYWSPGDGHYQADLLELALGAVPRLPRVLGPAEPAGTLAGAPAVLGPGTGDNAAAALGLGAGLGDVVVSIGTSGVISAVSPVGSADPTGIIAGFADATGNHLPLVCTLNAARVLSSTAALLHVSLDELSDLALAAPPGSDGLVVVPYLEGERTPNLPYASGAVHGLQPATMTAAHLARAAVEGLLCGLADGLDALRAAGVRTERVLLVGGGARSAAVRAIAPGIFGLPVTVPPTREYVAEGAARQAAWVLSGRAEPPAWTSAGSETYSGDPQPGVRARYAEARERILERPGVR